MILDYNTGKMVENNVDTYTPPENPPSYDLATDGNADYPSEPHPSSSFPLPTKDSKPSYGSPHPPPSHTVPSAGPSLPLTTVYHYSNPVTQENVASLLPPDHPQMICLQAGVHMPETKFGVLGILAAILWFPLGIGLCLLDRKVKCSRCGQILDEGVCG